MEFIPYILGVTESTEHFISASTTANRYTRRLDSELDSQLQQLQGFILGSACFNI